MLNVTSANLLKQGYGPQKAWWEKAYDRVSGDWNDIKNVARGGSLTGTLMNRYKTKKFDQWAKSQQNSGQPISGKCLKCGNFTTDGVFDMQNVSKSTPTAGGGYIVLCRPCANTYGVGAPGTGPSGTPPGPGPGPGPSGTP